MEKHLITTSDATGSEQPVEDLTFHSDPYFSRDSTVIYGSFVRSNREGCRNVSKRHSILPGLHVITLTILWGFLAKTPVLFCQCMSVSCRFL